MTFNNLIRIPNINDTPGFYYVYNISTPKINGIYVKSTQDSPAIKLGELSMWEDVIQNNLGVNILYNYYTVIDPRGIAPTGYHVPTYDDYTELQNFIGGGIGTAWIKLMSTEFGGNNDYGFTAIPCGIYDLNGFNFNSSAYLSSSLNPASNDLVGLFLFIQDTGNFLNTSYSLSSGGAIRFIKDDLINNISTTDFDGNIYHNVIIGNQIWTIENYKGTHYNNGDEIGSDFTISEGAMYDATTIVDLIHIQPKYNKRINANIIDGLPTIDPNVVIDENYVHTDNNYTTTEKNKLAGINEHFRGTYTTLDNLKLTIPIGIEGDEAIVDLGIESDPQKYIWDISDNNWKLGSGTAITTDNTIIEGSINPVSGGAVFNGLASKQPKKNDDELYVDPEQVTRWNAKEDVSNKTTVVSSTSTDLKYPSAKAVFDVVQLMGRQDTMLIDEQIIYLSGNMGSTAVVQLTYPPISKEGILSLHFGETDVPMESAISIDGNIITITDDNYKVSSGNFWAKYFTQIPNLALSEYATKVYVNDAIDAIPPSSGDSSIKIAVSKNGANGMILPQLYPNTKDRTITEVNLASNCNGATLTIGATSYNQATIIGVVLLAGQELIINDVSIKAGLDNANAVIILT